MKVIIEFDTETSAFKDNFDDQVSDLLTDAKRTVKFLRNSATRPQERRLLDRNGNTVGTVRVE